jgi:amino acid transporter
MIEFLAVVSILIVMAVLVPAAYRQFQTDRKKFIESIKAAAVYLVYCFIGIALVIVIMLGPQSESKVSAAWRSFSAGFSMACFGLCGLRLAIARFRPGSTSAIA